MKKDSIIRFNWSTATLIIVLLIYSVLIITSDLYLRLSADSILYLSIAEKYLNGAFIDAVNGYWGPLLSWLLIPFLYFGFSHVFAINSIYLISGVFAILGIWRLSFQFDITGQIRSIILLSLLPVILNYSLGQPFDLLLLCFLVYYFSIVFNYNYPERIQNGILCGILGSLAYLTKSYALPFFIAHFFTINVMHYIRNSTKAERKNVLRNALIGFVLFSLISGAWAAALSKKYNQITFSNMGKTNFAIVGPGTPDNGLEFGQPMFYKGFFEPPNKTAIVAWEDPSYIEVETWSPLESFSSFKYFIKLVLKNISQGLQFYESFSTLSIAIIIVYLLLICTQPFNKIISRGDLLYPVFTIALYTGGYILFHLEARYIWIVNILLLLMGGYVLNVLFQTEFFQKNLRKNILIAFFVISFIIVPSRHIIQLYNGNLDRDMYFLSTDLSKYNIKGNIASNREYVPVHDAWHKTFRLAYWLKGSRYYGQARLNISDDDLENELKKHNIEYYFYWGESKNMPRFLSLYREVTDNEISGLKVYSLKDKK